MISRTLIALTVAGALSLGSTAIFAQDMMLHGDEAIAKRQELMKSNGMTMRGAGAATGADAVAAAETLVSNFTMLKDLFPEDSMTGNTKALPAIWENREDFDMKLQAALDASNALLMAAQSNDGTYGDKLKALGGTCGACHAVYQAK